MVKRKLALKVYVLALAITIGIFLLGIYVGQLVDTQVTESLMEKMKFYYQESNSLQIMLLMKDSSAFCPLYLNESANLDQTTVDLGSQLTYLEQVKGIHDEDLKKQYFLLETKAYLFEGKVNKLCGLNKTLILYFYSKDCEKCNEQGNVLDSVAEELGNKIRIYSFDAEMESPAVESLKNEYNITIYPSLVIDEVTKNGFRNEDYLLNVLK